MKEKEIKFSSIEFSEISESGLIHHIYKWDKTNELLTHYVDNIQIHIYYKDEAMDIIKSLLYVPTKSKAKEIKPKTKDNSTVSNQHVQLKMF